MDAEATSCSLIDAYGQLMIVEASSEKMELLALLAALPANHNRHCRKLNRIGNLFTDHVSGRR
jgi:hypothetical protein